MKSPDEWKVECSLSAGAVRLELIRGKEAPRHSKYEALKCDRVAITEQGTEQHLPIIDFECFDQNGEFHLLSLTGRIAIAIGNAIKGVNMRNHGMENP